MGKKKKKQKQNQRCDPAGPTTPRPICSPSSPSGHLSHLSLSLIPLRHSLYLTGTRCSTQLLLSRDGACTTASPGSDITRFTSTCRMSRFSPPISLPCCVKLPSAPAHLPLPQPSLPQIPPHLPLSDTQRGRSPSLSVPAGKHMLLFPSDSGV